MTQETAGNKGAQYTYHEQTVPIARVSESGLEKPIEHAAEHQVDIGLATKLHDLLSNIKKELAALRLLLSTFDAANDVPEYNVKTLVGDNPMVYTRRQPVVDKINRLVELESRVIQKLNEL